MRGMIGGMLTGGLVSMMGLGAVSVISEQPAGVTPPAAPLVEAPSVEPVGDPVETPVQTDTSGPSTPVGSLMIEEPQAPELPEGEVPAVEPAAPAQATPNTAAPRADTDPLDEPEVSAIEGTMTAPDAPDSANLIAQPVEPVLPNPQSLPPQTPLNEADLTVSTTPSQPTVVVDPEVDVVVVDNPEAPAATPPSEDFFVVDLGADAADVDPAAPFENEVETPDDAMAAPNDEEDDDTSPLEAFMDAAPADQPEDIALNAPETNLDTPVAPRVQLLGDANTLLSNRDTGVTIRRPGSDDEITQNVAPMARALDTFAAEVADVGEKPLLSIVLIDDGTMSAASAALAGLPFSVTIALDPALPNAAELMEKYRADGFEVAVLAKVPEGAQPSDVEVTFESVFSRLPETIAVLDIGGAGLQSNRDVTEQAMDILATQGRGFISVSQGLNMAGRAAEQSGVPAVVVYRDLDIEGQDARVVRRFIDQAAFRARQESGVVLVGRVRPDTISALILWGTANNDDQVAVVPVSVVLNAQ